MVFNHPEFNGHRTKIQTYSSWDEVPWDSFVKWNKLAAEIDKTQERLNKHLEAYKQDLDQKHTFAFNSQMAKAEATERKLKAKLPKIEELQFELTMVEAEAVCLFSTLTIDQAAMLELASDKEHDDNHFNTYRIHLYNLARMPLPKESAKDLVFQLATDVEIEEVRQKLALLKWWKLSARKQLKRQLKAMVSHRYEVKDIWLHTTFANKQLQDLATNASAAVEQGDFSRLLPLVVAMFTESVANKELDQLKEQGAYIEKYQQVYINSFRRLLDIFQNSQRKVTVAEIVRLKNFFLSRPQKL